MLIRQPFFYAFYSRWNNRSKKIIILFRLNTWPNILKYCKYLCWKEFQPSRSLWFLLLLTIYYIPFVNNSHIFFDFRMSDYPKIISFLNSFHWSSTLHNLDANSAAYCLYDALHYSILNFVSEIHLISFLPGSQRN